MRSWTAFIVPVVLAALGSSAHAGGNLDVPDVTNLAPSPYEGEYLATLRGIRWDDRCVNVAFRMNDTLDPVSTTAGVPPLALAAATQAIADALETWNEIPTSYIEMNIEETTSNPTFPGFDFINEVSFRISPIASPTALGFSPSFVLVADSTLLHGEDLDLDGDLDVSGGIAACQDADGDGDIEFPAGFYKAGTILDNDVHINPETAWTVDGSHLDIAWDVQGMATHEFGHSHGLAHSGIVQKSDTDGTSAVMYGFGRDAVDKLAMRNLHTDELAWSSYLYPEGTRAFGRAALQKGDISFDKRYAVIGGEVSGADGAPLVGSIVFAEDLFGNIISSAIAGHARLSVDFEMFGAYPFDVPFNLLPPEHGIIDGRYELPVPKSVYRIGVEANDGTPDFTLATILGYIGYVYGSQTFVEEFYNGRAESTTELRIGSSVPVPALRNRKGIDIVLNGNHELLNFDAYNTYTWLGLGSDGILLAVHVPRDEIVAVDDGKGVLIQAATFGTYPLLTSEVATFRRAMITTGRIDAGGVVRIDVHAPLAVEAPFIGQDFDATPLYVDHSRALGALVKHVLPLFDREVFLVLELSAEEFPGAPFVSRHGIFGHFDPAGHPSPRSYYSADGGSTWVPEQAAFEYGFGLVVAPL